MLEPFIGTVICVPFNFTPRGWLACDGAAYPIKQSLPLAQILGNAFGGSPGVRFNVPDLRSRAPRHVGSPNSRGSHGGSEQSTLTLGNLPSHNHSFQASPDPANLTAPSEALLAAATARGVNIYTVNSALVPLSPGAILPVGGNQPHSNIQPYVAMNFIIADQGVFPNPEGPGVNDDDLFVGEIRIFASTLIPSNWTPCNGQLLAIASNQPLFNLIGNAYGGDGQTTFALPDLRGRLPLGAGQAPSLSNYKLGQSGGIEAVPLSINQMPPHSHNAVASSEQVALSDPSGNFLSIQAQAFNTQPPDVTLNARTVGTTGTGIGHDNMMPSLTLNFCICLAGTLPSRN